MIDLDGRVVMISGANRGIGRCIAAQLAGDGALVSLGARHPDALSEVTAELPDDRVLRHQYDATERGSDARWVAATLERFGRLDGLVNCAGILESFTLDYGDEAALDRMFEVNVKAPLRLTRLTLPHLRSSGEGRIVNLSSLSGIRVANDEVGYAISK
ncbi:MAG: SDR family NAD(P)-dependent oxidoreductase, partial [Acidimicrobiales bacterium]